MNYALYEITTAMPTYIHHIALFIGYCVLIGAGLGVCIAGVFTLIDWLIRKFSEADALISIICELHERKAFRWQKKDNRAG